jgi:exosortase/archaeosortase family protein
VIHCSHANEFIPNDKFQICIYSDKGTSQIYSPVKLKASDPFYFAIYGSAGKSFLFGLLAFVLLAKNRLLNIKTEKLSLSHLLYALTSVLCVIGFFLAGQQLLSYTAASQVPLLTFAAHVLLLAAGAFTFLAVFGRYFLLDMFRQFWRELSISVGLGVLFYFLFGFIFQLWPLLSKIVLVAVATLLRLTQPDILVVQPLTIQLPQFAITVGEYCSGIESLFLITTLYILIGCVEFEKLNLKTYLLLYFPLIIGMFCLNIGRVYLIILSGMWLGPEIAAKLFHTYLGMILFMGYFVIFLKLAAPILIH